MQVLHARHARSLSAAATVAVFTLLLASCAMPESREGQHSDEFDGTGEHLTRQACSGGAFACKARVVIDENDRIRPFATPAGLGPADLASAYKLNPAITSIATIAVIDAFHYANAESDLAAYRSTFGLPPCTVANGCLRIVPTLKPPPAGDDWNLEAALDLDMASAGCPTCKLALVEATDDIGNDLFVEQNIAAALSGVVSISNSWGGAATASDPTLDADFFTHTQSVNVFVSSGDGGSTGPAGSFPSTSPHVFAVGGTQLVKSTTAVRGWTETAWGGSGCTCGAFPEPAFQVGVVPTSYCTRRATADVAAVADPNTGVAVFNANDGGFVVVGGTSASSPFVAGVFARYGISGAAHNASFAYTTEQDFFDVTSGGVAPCRAARGWDPPTGVGTPNGAAL